LLIAALCITAGRAQGTEQWAALSSEKNSAIIIMLLMIVMTPPDSVRW